MKRIMNVLPGRWTRRQVEKMIGVLLPPRAAELHYYRFQPSTDLAFQEVWVQFRASREEYLDMVCRRSMTLFSDSGPTAHLPSAWQQPEMTERLDWWDASPETPSDAASATV